MHTEQLTHNHLQKWPKKSLVVLIPLKICLHTPTQLQGVVCSSAQNMQLQIYKIPLTGEQTRRGGLLFNLKIYKYYEMQ